MKYYPRPESGLDIHEVNLAVEAAFREHGMGNVQMPPKVYVTLPNGDFRTMPAYIPAGQLAGIKCVTVHPANPETGLPTIMALTTILDIESGLPLAILNATGLTDLRTGAAGAIATRYLAGKRSVTVGLVGTGRQAAAQLEAISREIAVTGVRAWSRKEVSAEKFAERSSRFDCRTGTLPVVCDCDVIVTTTPSRTPIIMDEWVHEGTHINAIGADAPGKEELDPAILKRAMVIVDDPCQAIHSGEINVPVREGKFSPEEIAGTLGEVVLGRKKRMNSEEITIFDSTGLAIQDLAIASVAMKNGNYLELEFP
jgi:alanine dehydrogenase